MARIDIRETELHVADIAGGADVSLPPEHTSQIHRRLPQAPLRAGVGHSAPHRVAHAEPGLWADASEQAL